MKKTIIIVASIIVVFIGCFFAVKYINNNNYKIEKIVDESSEIEGFECASSLDEFYEDDKFIYYFSCLKSDYVKVYYKNKKSETLKEAMEQGRVSVEDLKAYDVNYIIEKKA